VLAVAFQLLTLLGAHSTYSSVAQHRSVLRELFKITKFHLACQLFFALHAHPPMRVAEIEAAYQLAIVRHSAKYQNIVTTPEGGAEHLAPNCLRQPMAIVSFTCSILGLDWVGHIGNEKSIA
jgi:hypothetical protein